MNEKQVIARIKKILTETEEGTATADDLNISINEALNVIGHYEKIQAAFYPVKGVPYAGQGLSKLSSFDGSIFLGWVMRLKLRNDQDHISFICMSWDPEQQEWTGQDQEGMNRHIKLSDIKQLMVIKGGR